jgi:hypothetical protein
VALVIAIGPSLLVVMFFFFFSTPGYLSPIWGSNSHGVLHEKQIQNTVFVKQPRFAMNNICNPGKTPTKPTCKIETKTNNIAFVANPKLSVKQL